MFVAKPRGTNFAKFFTFGPDAKMRQIETIKPFLPKSNSPHNHWVSPGSLLRSQSQSTLRAQAEIRDWILWSALAPAQGGVNGQFDTKYQREPGVWRTITRPGSLPSLADDDPGAADIVTMSDVTRSPAWSLDTGQAQLCRHQLSGVLRSLINSKV